MSRQTRLSTRFSASDPISKRKRHTTKVSYKESDSGDDHSQESDDEFPQRKKMNKTSRARKRNPKRQSNEASLPTLVSAPKHRRKLRRRASRSSASETLSTSTLSIIDAVGSTQGIGTDVTSLSINDPMPEPRLPWTTLEYHILLDIFLYGARMLKDDKKTHRTWLINLATVCKAFQVPALTALYQNPPLGTVEAVRGFLAASARNPEFFSTKVKYIEIEAIPALTRKDRAQDPVLLETILGTVPNIRGLAVELHGDAPSSKRGVANLPSRGKANVFKPAMIDTMETNSIHLRSMKWNYFFNPDQQWPWCVLPEIHSRSCMQTIERLEIVWLNVFTKSINKRKQIESLVEGIKVLPNLRSLTLSLCSLFYKKESFLTELPTNLESFTTIDCDDLTSESLSDFLLKHGSNLRHLILSHNRSLDLGFTDVLGSACPLLEEFKVDISCYGLMMSSTDSEPSFQCLLPEGTIPTWPVSLRQIEMSYLRKWGREAATIFFQSLADSAQELLNLRHLIIKTTVDLDWRDRVAFRDEWSERLHLIFKRRSTPPRSIHSIVKYQNTRIIGTTTKPNGSNTVKAKESIASRLKRRSHDNTDNNSIHKDDNMTPSLPNGSNLFTQGLCDVVDIRIENLRPMETQYAEVSYMPFWDVFHSSNIFVSETLWTKRSVEMRIGQDKTIMIRVLV